MAFAFCLAISREHTCDIIVLGMCLWDPPGDAGRHEDTPDDSQVMDPRSHPHDRAGTSSNRSLDTIIDFVLDRQLYSLDNFGFTRFRSVLRTAHLENLACSPSSPSTIFTFDFHLPSRNADCVTGAYAP